MHHLYVLDRMHGSYCTLPVIYFFIYLLEEALMMLQQSQTNRNLRPGNRGVTYKSNLSPGGVDLLSLDILESE